MREGQKLVNFIAKLDDLARWDEAAHQARKSRSRWITELLNDAVGGPVPYVAPPVTIATKTRAREVAEDLKDRAAVASSGVCENRVPKGAFCKRCGRIHD